MMNRNVKTLLNEFSKRDVELLDDVLKEELQVQTCAQSLRSIHLSMSRKTFFVGGSSSCLEDSVGKGNIIQCKPELPNQAKLIFACHNSRRSKKMYNNFLLVSGDEKPMIYALSSNLLTLICLNTQTDSFKTNYIFLQYLGCTLLLREVDKEQSCVCLRWSTTDEEDHSSIAEEELKVERI